MARWQLLVASVAIDGMKGFISTRQSVWTRACCPLLLAPRRPPLPHRQHPLPVLSQHLQLQLVLAPPLIRTAWTTSSTSIGRQRPQRPRQQLATAKSHQARPLARAATLPCRARLTSCPSRLVLGHPTFTRPTAPREALHPSRPPLYRQEASSTAWELRSTRHHGPRHPQLPHLVRAQLLLLPSRPAPMLSLHCWVAQGPLVLDQPRGANP